MPVETAAVVAPIERNLKGLVTALFDELDNMRTGAGSEARVRQVCAIAGRVNAIVNTEMKFRRMAGANSDMEARAKAITG